MEIRNLFIRSLKNSYNMIQLDGAKLNYTGKLNTHPYKTTRSLASLFGLLRMLDKRHGLLPSYDPVIQDQIEQAFVELVHSENNASPMFYLPHKPVVRETVESAKLQVVHHACLNDFL